MIAKMIAHGRKQKGRDRHVTLARICLRRTDQASLATRADLPPRFKQVGNLALGGLYDPTAHTQGSTFLTVVVLIELEIGAAKLTELTGAKSGPGG